LHHDSWIAVPLDTVYRRKEYTALEESDMPMTPQPTGVTRTPVGTERPARVHIIRYNRKFVGYTVRLEAGQDKWAALSPDGALVGETKTHNEALALLAPDAEAKPRKTSVYLD